MAVAVQARRQTRRFASEAVRSLIRRRLAELGAVFLALAGLAVFAVSVALDRKQRSARAADAACSA